MRLGIFPWYRPFLSHYFIILDKFILGNIPLTFFSLIYCTNLGEKKVFSPSPHHQISKITTFVLSQEGRRPLLAGFFALIITFPYIHLSIPPIANSNGQSACTIVFIFLFLFVNPFMCFRMVIKDCLLLNPAIRVID